MTLTQAPTKSRDPPCLAGVTANSRREKLETIMHREQMKDHLFQKYRDRFAHRSAADDEVSVASATIRREVDRFIGSAAPITEANISRLERRLHRCAHNGRTGVAGDAEVVSNFSISSYTVGSTAPSDEAQARAAQARAARAPRAPRALTAREPALGKLGSLGTAAEGSAHGSLSARGSRGSTARVAAEVLQFNAAGAWAGGAGTARAGLEWSVLDKLAAVMHKQDAVRQRSRAHELQERLRHDLDKQLFDGQLKQEREREFEHQYHEMQISSEKRLHEQELEKETARQHKIMARRENAAAQIEADRLRREEDRTRERQEARELMDSMNREMELDRLRSEQRLHVRMQQAQEALRAGSDAHRQREELLKNRAMNEDQSLEEYQRLLASREKKAKDTQAKEQRVRQLLDDVAAEREKAKRLQEEAMLAKAATERAAKDKHDAEWEKANQERLAEMRLQTQAYLFQQIQERQTMKEQEQDNRRNWRVAQENNAKQQEAAEKSRDLSRRLRNREHRAELERQIAARIPIELEKEVMSECELRLNKQLLQRVTEALATIPGA